ncbi:MAG: hypothetical protein ABIH35_04455 [Patescibacteria group bacterium]
MKTKTKNAEAKKLSKQLYNLLSDAEVISDGERGFWLQNYPQLSAENQEKVADMIKHGEKELQKENEAHISRVAEIDTKCVVQLHEIAKTNGLKASAGDDEDIDPDEAMENFDPDQIWQEVKQAGEV